MYFYNELSTASKEVALSECKMFYKEYFKNCLDHNIINIITRENWQFTISGNLI